HPVEKFLHGERATGADIVRTAWQSMFEDHGVGKHRIANIGETAARLEVADGNFRRPLLRFDVGDAARPARADEPGILPRAEMIERARDENVGAAALVL